MNIVVSQSGYALENMGDVAMLQAAVTRLRRLWPDATIHVRTSAPDKLAAFCPDARPFAVPGHTLWSSPLLDSVDAACTRLPRQIVARSMGLEPTLRRRRPALFRSLLALKLSAWRRGTEDLDASWRAVATADLVVASGEGISPMSSPFWRGARYAS